MNETYTVSKMQKRQLHETGYSAFTMIALVVVYSAAINLIIAVAVALVLAATGIVPREILGKILAAYILCAGFPVSIIWTLDRMVKNK